MIKINCDGAFDANTGAPVLLGIARNSTGERVSSVGMAEAMALYYSIQFAEEKNWRRIMLETDFELFSIT